MSRWMIAAVCAGLVVVGGCGKKGPPSMPKSESRVAEIQVPADLGNDQRAADYMDLLVTANRAISGFNRFATNVDGLGDKASPELKQAVTDLESKVNELRTKVESARSSGAIAPLKTASEKLLAEIQTTGEQVIQ